MSETLIQNELSNLAALKESIASESCIGNSPFIRLGDGSSAPELDYNLPQNSTFTTYGSIRIDTTGVEFKNISSEEVYDGDSFAHSWAEGIQLGINDLMPSINAKAFRKAVNSEMSDFMAVSRKSLSKDGDGGDSGGSEPTSSSPNIVINGTCLNEEQIANLMNRGYLPVATKKLNGFGTRLRLIKQPAEPHPGLFIIEEYKTSSYLGRYGAGKVLQTLSLLPGEKTTITVKTYKNSTSTRSQSENLLDSFSQESVDEMETLMEEENGSSEQENGSVSASISASLFGITAEVGASYSSQRSANSRALNRALGKHVEQSNSARNVEINTTMTETVTEGEEYTTVREIENVNKSRVLNFVFRQLLQEYISITFLSNIRIAYFDGRPSTLRIVDVENIDTLLEKVLKTPAQDASTIKDSIMEQYLTIKNSSGEQVPFLKMVSDENPVYWTCQAEGSYFDGSNEIPVNGVILQVQTNVLRTDSVIADAVMGHGEALDCFNQRAQDAIAIGEYLKNLEQMQRISLIESIRNMEDNATKAALLKVLLGEKGVPPHPIAPTSNDNPTEP